MEEAYVVDIRIKCTGERRQRRLGKAGLGVRVF
jgi:hypothetical protein